MDFRDITPECRSFLNETVQTIFNRSNLTYDNLRKKLKREEALKLFMYIIEKVYSTSSEEVNKPMDVFKKINYLLSLISNWKLYYYEFLNPNETTTLAIDVLILQVYKLHSDTQGKALIDEVQHELDKKEQLKAEVQEWKKRANEGGIKCEKLKEDIERKKNILTDLQRQATNADDDLNKLKQRLQVLIDEDNALAASIEEIQEQSKATESEYEKKSELLRLLSSYESIMLKLQKVNEEIEKINAIVTEKVPARLDEDGITQMKEFCANVDQWRAKYESVEENKKFIEKYTEQINGLGEQILNEKKLKNKSQKCLQKLEAEIKQVMNTKENLQQQIDDTRNEQETLINHIQTMTQKNKSLADKYNRMIQNSQQVMIQNMNTIAKIEEVHNIIAKLKP